jgi:hypothetical protein
MLQVAEKKGTGCFSRDSAEKHPVPFFIAPAVLQQASGEGPDVTPEADDERHSTNE